MIRSSVALLLLAALFTPAASAREILLHQSFAHPVEKEREPRPLRTRVVEPDFDALRRDSELTVSLFDDVVLPVTLTNVTFDANGTASWSGRVEGEPDSCVLLSIKDNAMSAMISFASRRFAIEPGENGVHEAIELDPRAFPDESEPIEPLELPHVASDATLHAADSAQFFDLLVVYTDDLRASLGGTAAAQTAVSHAVAAANLAYANSGVTARIRLVGTAEVAYEDDGELATALHALRDDNDGILDGIHSLRDRVGADAVSMLVVKGGGSCGVSYIMTAPRVRVLPRARSASSRTHAPPPTSRSRTSSGTTSDWSTIAAPRPQEIPPTRTASATSTPPASSAT